MASNLGLSPRARSPSPSKESNTLSTHAATNGYTNLTLTDEQKRLIRTTWSDDFDFLYEIGTEIYAYIFTKEPDSKKLFPAADEAGDQWRESKIFKKQALKFVQILSQAVTNLQYPEHMTPLLYRVGKAHIKFRDRGFVPRHWDIFLEAIQTVLGEVFRRKYPEMRETDYDQLMVGWRQLSGFLITQMQNGFIGKEPPTDDFALQMQKQNSA